MELWEFNTCVQAHNAAQKEAKKERLTTCWQIAAFTGAAFAGKLKKLDRYIKEAQRVDAPKVDKDEFEKRLAAAERKA